MQPAILEAVGGLIRRTINFEQSETCGRPVVALGVDCRLDSLRHSYDGLEPLLTEVAATIGEAYSTSTTKELCRCVFFPQLGFLTVIDKIWLAQRRSLGIHATPHSDWEQKFVDQARIYYKNGYMKDLDDRFGDLYGIVAGMLR